jgi:hypothetical protein
MRSAATTMTAANPSRTRDGSSRRLTAAPPKAATPPVTPKMAARRHCTSRSRGSTAAADEMPTTSSDIGTAAANGRLTP